MGIRQRIKTSRKWTLAEWTWFPHRRLIFCLTKFETVPEKESKRNWRSLADFMESPHNTGPNIEIKNTRQGHVDQRHKQHKKSDTYHRENPTNKFCIQRDKLANEETHWTKEKENADGHVAEKIERTDSSSQTEVGGSQRKRTSERRSSQTP